MIKDEVKLVNRDKIKIRPNRQRKELKGIEELADSIDRNGLINPILITPDFYLVAGERRFTAMKMLSMVEVPCRFTTDLPEDELHIIELEENVKRQDLTWRENVKAIHEYHELKRKADRKWTVSQTAEALGIAQSHASRCILVQQYIDSGDDLVSNADTFKVASNIVSRKQQRASEDNADFMNEAIGEYLGDVTETKPKPTIKSEDVTSDTLMGSMQKDTKPKSTKPKASGDVDEGNSAKAEAPKAPEPKAPIINGDFTKMVPATELPKKYNFLHCDFPYGIGFDKHDGGATGTFGGYADSPDVYWNLIGALERAMDTMIAPSAHMMFWLSARQDIVQPTMEALTKMGWTVNPVPMIWHRSDNAGVLPDPKRGPRQVYELCLLCTRGDRFIVQAVSNLFAHAKTKEVHASEKPREMLSHFFRMFVDENTIMLDPTCGSGNSVIAAHTAGAKAVTGIEIDPKFHSEAARQWFKLTKEEV